MPNERLAAGIDHDDAAGLGEHLAAALFGFTPRAAEIVDALRPLAGGTGRDRRQRLRGWRRLRNRRGNRGRCTPSERRAAGYSGLSAGLSGR
jgi:hypothetical protein